MKKEDAEGKVALGRWVCGRWGGVGDGHMKNMRERDNEGEMCVGKTGSCSS